MVIDVDNYEDNDGDNETSTDIDIGPVKDADTGEIETPASETGDGSTPDNNDTGGGGGGSTVVVPESPSEREKLKESGEGLAVGAGDTRQEAVRDAARNPGFDADSDTDTGRTERKLETNQALQNPEGSTNTELKKAAQRIAGSEKFQGDRIGRQAGKLAEQLKQRQQLQNRKKRKRQIPQRTDLLQTATPQNINQNTGPTREKENKLVTGRETIGEKVFEVGKAGAKFSQQLEKTIDQNEAVNSAFQLTGAGQTLQKLDTRATQGFQTFQDIVQDQDVDVSTEELLNLGFGGRPGRQETELEKQSKEIVATGLAAEPIEDASAIIGGAGATTALTREALQNNQPVLQTIGAATATGLGKQAEAFQENPSEIRQELVGLAADATPASPVASTVSKTAGKANQVAPRQVSDTISTITGLKTGELGSKTTQDNLIKLPENQIEEQALNQKIRNLQPTGSQKTAAAVKQAAENTGLKDNFIIKNVEQNPGATTRQAVGKKEGDIIIAERREEPITRTEFIKDLATNEKGEIIGLQTTSKGQLQLSGQNTKTDVDTVDTTGKDITTDQIFEETNTQSTTPQQTNTGVEVTPKINTQIENQEDLQIETPGQKTRETPEEINIEIPKQRNIPKEETNTQTLTTPEQELIPEEEIIPTTQTKGKNRPRTSLFGLGGSDSKETDFVSNDLISEDSEAAPSVDAILFGETTDQKVEDDTLFTGFETRKIDENEPFNLF